MKPSRLLGARCLPARPCCRGRGPRRGLSRQAHHADRALPRRFRHRRGRAHFRQRTRPSWASRSSSRTSPAPTPPSPPIWWRAPARRLHDLRHHQHLALGRALADEERALRPREGLHAHRARRQPALHPGRQPQTALENGRRPGRRCAPAPRAHHLCQRQQHRHRGRRHAARRANIDILHVPYKGTPQGLTDVVGGQVISCSPTWLPACLRAVRPVAGAGGVHRAAQRHRPRPALDGRIRRAGFRPELLERLLRPGRTAARVVARLNAAINQVVAKPETRQRLAALGFDAFSGTPQDFARFVGEQRDLWGKLIRDAGIEQQ